MKGKTLAVLMALVFLGILMLHAGHSRDRWMASFRLAQVESLVIRLQAEGHLSRASSQRGIRRALDKGLELLRNAEELDPAEVEIPIAEGIIYNLLQRPKAAIRAYERARGLEPRPEVFANLGRIHLQEGNREEARLEFQKAVILDHTLRRELRPYLPKKERSGTELVSEPGAPPKKARKKKKRRRKRQQGPVASAADQGLPEEIFSDSFESGDTSRWTEGSERGEQGRERDE